MKQEDKTQEEQYIRPYHHLINIEQKQSYDYLYWGLEYYGYVSFILNKLDQLKFKSILDIGCGDGKITLDIAKKYPFCQIEGYDLSRQAIMFANAYAIKQDNLKFYQENFNNSIDKYDIILLIETLEHIPQIEVNTIIKNISSKLNKEGKLLISVPTTNLKLNKKHYRHYYKDLLETHTKDYFDIETIDYVHKEHSLGYKILRSILINRFFILNNIFMKSLCYDIYMKKYLPAKFDTGTHMIAILKLKK